MFPGSDASSTKHVDPGKEVTAHLALVLWIQTGHKHLDGKSWTELTAALPWVTQGWGQEERAWHCTVNHGKIQPCYFKSCELKNQCHS